MRCKANANVIANVSENVTANVNGALKWREVMGRICHLGDPA